MIDKIVENLLFHQKEIILNQITKETSSAGLGPIEQYSVSLFVFFIVLIIWWIKKIRRKIK